MSKVTLVTALYDIQREKMAKIANNYRPFSDYQRWFRRLLQINCPLVIYLPASLQEELKYRPQNYPTEVRLCEFEKLPIHRYRDQIVHNMHQLPSKGVSLKNIEFINPDYSVVIHSKMLLLNQEREVNPFQSQYIFWIDAGFQRQDWSIDITQPWPDSRKIEMCQNKFLFMTKSIPQTIHPMEFLKRNENQITAYFFGGHVSTIGETTNRFLQKFHWMLDQGLINNEQNLFTWMVAEDKQSANPLFLSCPILPIKEDRLIVEELSSQRKLRNGLYRDNRLMVVSLISREISEQSYHYFRESLDNLGYNYEIIGKQDRWQGWQYRTNSYINFIRAHPEQQIFVLCDSTDLFFVGSPDELYTKFTTQANQRVIMGGEHLLAYNPAGKYNHYIMEDYFSKLGQSRNMFPNAGFVIGYRDELLHILEQVKECRDDQAGYCDYLYEHGPHLGLDYDNLIIGNVPNLHTYNNFEIEAWEQDPVDRRMRSKVTGNKPVAFHFPGRNNQAMAMFYNKQAPSTVTESSGNTNYIAYIVIGVLIILSLLMFLFWRNIPN